MRRIFFALLALLVAALTPVCVAQGPFWQPPLSGPYVPLAAQCGSSNIDQLFYDYASSPYLEYICKADGWHQVGGAGGGGTPAGSNGQIQYNNNGSFGGLSIIPTAAPAPGQFLVGNAGGTAYVARSLGGDCSLAATGVITCTKSNGSSFGSAAFQNISLLFNKMMAFWQNYGDSFNACYGAPEQTHNSWCALFASSVNTNEIAPDRAVGGTTIWQIGDAMWQYWYSYANRAGILTVGDGANDGAHDPSSFNPSSEYALNWIGAHNAALALGNIPSTYRCMGSSVYNAGTYAAGTTYPINAVVTYSSVLYYSLVSGNIGNTPSSSPSQWAVFETPNALAGVYSNAASTASIQTQCGTDSYAGTWSVDNTVPLNTSYGIVNDLMISGTQASTTGASASITKTFNDPSGQSTQLGVTIIKATTTAGTFGQLTITVDGTPVTDPVSGTTTFSENTTSGTAIYPASVVGLFRVPVTVTPASTHTVVVTTTAGNAAKVVLSSIDMVPPSTTPGINYVIDGDGNSNYGGQTTYDYLHYKDDQSFISAGMPIIPMYQQTLVVTNWNPGSGYTSNPTCTLSGGTIINGGATPVKVSGISLPTNGVAPTCTANQVSGGIVLVLNWPSSSNYAVYCGPTIYASLPACSGSPAAPTISLSGGGGSGASFTLMATPGPGVTHNTSVGGDLAAVPSNVQPQTYVGGHPSLQGGINYYLTILASVENAGYNLLSPGANGMAGGGSSLGPIDENPVAAAAGVGNVSYKFLNGKPNFTSPAGASISQYCMMMYPAFIGICDRTDSSSNGPWSGATNSIQVSDNFGWFTVGTNAGTAYTNNLTPKFGVQNGTGLTFSLGNRNNLTGTTAITASSFTSTGVTLPQIPSSTTAYTGTWNGSCVINWQQSANTNTVQFGVGMNANPTNLVVTNKDDPGAYAATVTTSSATWTTPTAVSGTDTPSAANTTYTNRIDFQLRPTTTTTQTITIYALTSGGTLTIQPSWCKWDL